MTHSYHFYINRLWFTLNLSLSDKDSLCPLLRLVSVLWQTGSRGLHTNTHKNLLAKCHYPRNFNGRQTYYSRNYNTKTDEVKNFSGPQCAEFFWTNVFKMHVCPCENPLTVVVFYTGLGSLSASSCWIGSCTWLQEKSASDRTEDFKVASVQIKLS